MQKPSSPKGGCMGGAKDKPLVQNTEARMGRDLHSWHAAEGLLTQGFQSV